MFITESNHIKVLSIALILGFLIPITVSTYNVVLGRHIEMIEFWNQVPRHTGAFSGSHVLAYTMLFFSFLYCILHHVYQFENSISRYFIGMFLLLSVYCLYQSHTRTAIIGLIIFWYIYLWGNRKKLFYGAIVLSIVGGIVFHSNITRLVLKKSEYDLNTMTSGRISIWAGNIQEFIDSSLPQQLLGRGLGHEHRYPFHNDYITLLMSLGIIGVLLYIILLFSLLWDIYLCRDRKTKYLFGAILISAAAMNFGSNAVVFRLELSQYFWLIMGLFYCISQLKNDEYDTKRNHHRDY
jgi:O-antigen ligase